MLRFLDLVRKELDAQDTRAELGGLDPDDDRLLWARIAGGFRVVVVFSAPPPDRDDKQAHLDHLVAGFAQTLTQASLPAPPSVPETPVKRLDEALEALRARTGAVNVVIVDSHSPVMWGACDPERHGDDVGDLVKTGDAIRTLLAADVDLDAICALRGPDAARGLRELSVRGEALALLARVLEGSDETVMRHNLLTCLAVARTRHEVSSPTPTPNSRWVHHDVQFGYLVRGFANIYLLVLVFEGAFSELYVESAVVHGLPAIEQMLIALPPQDPTPGAKRGRVIPMRGR
ncbi:MAG TPA: hypothetical protein VK509_22130 [Polyangiales bacterium]|nr:hypothetical protein [Polyangiales bacterium]